MIDSGDLIRLAIALASGGVDWRLSQISSRLSLDTIYAANAHSRLGREWVEGADCFRHMAHTELGSGPPRQD